MELLRAQFAAYSKQIPLLYFILCTNTLATAWTFWPLTPVWLSIYFPAILCVVCVIRCLWWWKARDTALSDAKIVRQMRLTTHLSVALTLIFTIWGLSLYPYGDPYARGQVIFYMALTVIGCVFCLMLLRPAALGVTITANIPFVLFFFFEGHSSLKAISVNQALVSAAMIIILLTYSRNFARLVASQGETRRLSDENFRIANLDLLTGLPNRRWFFTELHRQQASAAASGRGFAVGIIDLDGFKPVNDTYGHATGDRVLTEAAQRIQTACNTSVILCRLGGDEFGFLMDGNPAPEDLQALGNAINDVVSLPFSIGGSHAPLGCSIGVAFYPRSADTAELLFERADYALYHAKRHLRGQMVIFSTEHEEQIRSHGAMERALLAADLDTELSMVFQPIVNLKTGRAVAMEGLARWQSPSLGAIPPDQFIALAERTGLIRSVTKALLKKALAAAISWPDSLRISFNLSAHDLSDAESVVQIIALVNQSGINPKRIDFEITETAMTHDFQQAYAAVRTLKAMGAGVSLDDFGTGFSSLSHVHRLPLDKIKVDRSFITDLGRNSVSLKIVKSLTALCTDMGLDCIVEGVETEAQLAILRDLGCTLAQGYYFARPMPAEAVLDYLDEAEQRRA
ncbi:putative bifunctional diguanylate cyclase/phosphodiesterase [Asticcacaulis sp. 201]|uniref:putative bifunctional diguanylate cyclase/phosphodiesterase n=1 Tax=Asticcacaulis sp. 201 TaxID=3028787 RepID=UPI002916C389|nr:EAL domain-containing protein [Asticcacaulis sp. 201]MDV6332342.1 EAL domain-containing protein [Asticcacaulis sp. 201]